MANEIVIRVPDIGDFDDVEVIELLVAQGDQVGIDQSLVTLESEKATMEIPSTSAGVVTKLHVGLGDRVGEGSPLVTVQAVAELEAPQAAPAAPVVTEPPRPSPPRPAALASPPTEIEKPRAAPPSEAPPVTPVRADSGGGAHASPSVRRLARELGVDLARVTGSGRKGRVRKDDVQSFVKSALSSDRSSGPGFALPEAPEIDFSRFGETERVPETKIRRASARNLHRSWITVPHVTQFDEADITELEAYRQSKKAEAKDQGVRLTLLSFLLQASARVLREFPRLNASLDPSGEALIFKSYFNIGVAVDTENGLVVPVIRDVDQKGLWELAHELADVSERARSRKLSPADMSGGCFSISSLGGIGGTSFTPIVNPPEVAILGVSRSRMSPVYRAPSSDQEGEGAFEPRLLLPLSLSYDHRVIDGAYAARVTRAFAEVLEDIRDLLL